MSGRKVLSETQSDRRICRRPKEDEEREEDGADEGEDETGDTHKEAEGKKAGEPGHQIKERQRERDRRGERREEEGVPEESVHGYNAQIALGKYRYTDVSTCKGEDTSSCTRLLGTKRVQRRHGRLRKRVKMDHFAEKREREEERNRT